MKKLLYILLFITSFTNAQRAHSCYGLAPQTGEYMYQCQKAGNTPEPVGNIAKIDVVIKSEIGCGNWAKMDRLWFFGTHIAANALISLINPSPLSAWPTTVVLVNGLSQVQDSGFRSDGSSKYANLEYNPATNGVNYTQNSAELSVYCSTAQSTNNDADIGCSNGTNAALLSNYGNTGVADAYFYSNSGNLLYSTTPSASNYLSQLIRTSSSSVTFYYNNSTGTIVGTQTSAGVPSYNMFALCFNSSGTPGQFTKRMTIIEMVGGALPAPLTWYNDANKL